MKQNNCRDKMFLKYSFSVLLALLLFLAAFASLASLPVQVQNGDFSQRLAAWDNYSWVADGCDISVDNGVARIYSPGFNDARLHQEIAVDPNMSYCVSAEVRVEDIKRERDRGAGIGFDMTTAFVEADDDNPDWQQLTLYVQTGPSQKSARLDLALGGYSNEASGIAYFRNVSIEETEIPNDVLVYNIDTENYTSSSEEEDSNEINYPGDFMAKIIFAALSAAFIYAVWRWTKNNDWLLDTKIERIIVISVLLIALIVRIAVLLISEGYQTDTRTFAAWAGRLAATPFSEFYQPDLFCDYPPGILYLMGFSARLAKVFGITVLQSGIGLLFIFMPVLLCDVGIVYVGWRYSRQKLNQMQSIGIMLILAFLPTLIYDTAVWHQVDSVLGLLLIVTFWMLEKKEKKWAAFFYGLAVVAKPQALIAGPVFAMPFFFDLFTKDSEQRNKSAFDLLLGVVISLGTIFALSLPFQGEQSIRWLMDKYITTTSSYPYASVNAFNIWALFGGNFVSQDTMLGPLSFVQWAGIGTVVSISATIALYLFMRKRKEISYFLLAAFLFAMVFAFGPRMHERYSYPILIFLPFAYVKIKDKGLLNAWCFFSAAIYCNIATALYTLKDSNSFFSQPSVWTSRICSLFMVLSTIYLAMVSFDICVRGHVFEEGRSSDKKDDEESSEKQTGEEADLIENAPNTAEPFENEEKDQKTADDDEEWYLRSDGATVKKLRNRLKQEPDAKRLNWKKLDTILMLALTLVYAAVAFVNIGIREVPQSYWRSESSQAESSGQPIKGVDESITVRFDGTKQIKSVWTYGGISKGSLRISGASNEPFYVMPSDNGYQEIPEAGEGEAPISPIDYVDVKVSYDVMYRWNVTLLNIETSELVLATISNDPNNDIWLNEIAFVDPDGNTIAPIEIIGPTSEGFDPDSSIDHLLDENDLRPDRPDRKNGMYFDELYHARTAYEHLNGLKPYENTHPPLGKIFIMLGIAIFGMNPFGWRCVGTLIGVLMLPIIYVFAKRMFKKTKWAFFVTFMFAFDFMHFVQTRIATIDVYGVFFILLMYYFMYEYWQMNFYTDGLKATLRPLALSGLMFGLGAASKWICLYAGAGLAVIFFASLAKRSIEYLMARSAKNNGEAGADEMIEYTKDFGYNTLGTLCLCIIAFILVPLLIYIASYIPYFYCTDNPYTLGGVVDVQKFMLSYHSNLTSRHSFESHWWTWPLIIRPIFYYSGSMLPEGMGAGISAFGNPAVWWSGFAGLIAMLLRSIKNKRFDNMTVFLLMAFAAQFVPWMFISRATFIYHYFASVPFIIFALTHVLSSLEEKTNKAWYASIVLMVLALVLFIIFYPELSGMPVSRDYLVWLQWLPRWTW